MPMIQVTDYNDRRVSLAIDNVKEVKDYPAGQTMLRLADGTVLQVKESLDEVMSRLERAAGELP